MMAAWQALAQTLIQSFEGEHLMPYRCPAGIWTVGWGHCLTLTEKATGSFPLQPQEAEALLIQDIQRVYSRLLGMIRVPLYDHEEAALVSFAYNVGLGAFQRSTLRQRLNRQEFEAIPHQLNRWVYAKGRKLPGLVQRRHIEGLLFQGRLQKRLGVGHDGVG